MDHRSAVEVADKGVCSHSAEMKQKNKKCPSVNHSEHRQPTPPALVRANTPSKYLRRKGLMPSPKAFQVTTGNNGILCLSSSSSTTSCSSTTSSPTGVSPTWLTLEQTSPSLPSLTGDNLARLMLQLELSRYSLAQPDHCHFRSSFTPNPNEISYFSSETSAYSDSDPFEL